MTLTVTVRIEDIDALGGTTGTEGARLIVSPYFTDLSGPAITSTAPVVVDLDAGQGSFGLAPAEVRLIRPVGVAGLKDARWVVLPPADAEISLAELVIDHSVDPATLEPLQPLPPSAQQILDDAATAVESAEDASTEAGVKAFNAGQSAAAALGHANDAADSAVEAGQAASNAVAEALVMVPTVVYNGTDANFPRPADAPGPVFWVGEVDPYNKESRDIVIPAEPTPLVPVIDWLHYYEATALGLADLAPVTTWADARSAHLDLTAPSGKEPTFRAAGGGSPARVQFTRTSSTVGDALVSAAAPDAQEIVMVAVVRPSAVVTLTANTDRRRIFGGIDASFNLALDLIGGGETPTSLPRYRLSNVGQVDVHNGELATTNWTVLVAHFNASETWLRINGVEESLTAITSSNRTGGYTLGAGVGATGNFFDGYFQRFGVVQGLPADLLDYETYLIDLVSTWS